MESLTHSTQKKSQHAVHGTASVLGAHVDAQAAERASVLGVVTGSEYSTVAQPSASGTCGSVHQSVEQADPAAPHPEAKLCLQSTQGAETPIYKVPERFTTLAEVSANFTVGKLQFYLNRKTYLF